MKKRIDHIIFVIPGGTNFKAFKALLEISTRQKSLLPEKIITNCQGTFVICRIKIVSAHKLNGGGSIVRGREWGWGRVGGCVAGRVK